MCMHVCVSIVCACVCVMCTHMCTCLCVCICTSQVTSKKEPFLGINSGSISIAGINLVNELDQQHDTQKRTGYPTDAGSGGRQTGICTWKQRLTE